MMSWLKRIGVVVVALLVLAVGAVFAALQLGERKMQRKVEVSVQPAAPRGDPQSLERGKYLYVSRGCVHCHGANGGGRVFVDNGDDMRLRGPNISPGAGSAVAGYQASDWVRAIRHGIAPGGRPLMIMPSQDYGFTDADLASLVAYVQAFPAATGGPAEVKLPLPARVLYGFGLIEDAAAKIDHRLPAPQPVPEAVSLQHGAYVANMCLGCHGPQLAGGRIRGGPPDWPAAANLRPGPGTGMASYPDAQSMLKMFKTGKRPDATPVKVMPFESLREMSETDVRALHLYLQSLKPLAKG